MTFYHEAHKEYMKRMNLIDINYIDFGDRIKTKSGFTITISDGAQLTEEDGKVYIRMNVKKSYGKLKIYDEVIAIYKRICKIKRKNKL